MKGLFVSILIKKIALILLLLGSSGTYRILANEVIDDDYDLGDIEINLELLRSYEEKHPPTFSEALKLGALFAKEHVKHNKGYYIAGTLVALATGYCFKDHLWNNKYKYFFGSTGVASTGFLYAWWKFNQQMKCIKHG